MAFVCQRYESGLRYFSGIACWGQLRAIAAEAAPTVVIRNVGAASAAIVEQRLRFYGTAVGSTLVYLKRRGPQSRYYQRLLSPRIGMILPVSSQAGIQSLDKGRQGVID